MSTGITWTEETWNPIVGCSIVSKGCTNCYAMSWAGQRMDGNPNAPHYAGTTKQVNGKHVWTGKLAQASEATLLKPLRWKRPRMIFVNSMSDLFHEDMPEAWIDQVLAVMALTPQHTYQILTKRPDRMKAYLTDMDADRIASVAARIWGGNNPDDIYRQAFEAAFSGATYVLRNVWLGVSIEDQATADQRIPDLLDTPAAVRWISAEPLLGPVDLSRIKAPDDPEDPDGRYTMNVLSADDYYTEHFEDSCNSGTDGPERERIDWVVAGGESGTSARPMHPDWVRQLRDQCAAEERPVPFFFKQWGEWAPQLGSIEIFEAGERSRYRWAEWCQGRCDGNLKPLPDAWEFRDQPMWFEHEDMDETQTLIRVGKKTAGDLLDGVQHHNWPEAITR